jgi:muconate cycloisomerase
MKLSTQAVTMKKRYPLRISRELITESRNLLVTLQQGDLLGVGEVATDGNATDNPEAAACELSRFTSDIGGAETLPDSPSIFDFWHSARSWGMSPAVLAGLDIALWDLHAKKLGKPLYHVLGLSNSLVSTSITVGINPPEVLKERVPEILARTGATVLKIKLGASEGIEADQSSFMAIHEAVKNHQGVALRVDANGGWSLKAAQQMMPWLEERGVEFIEQPLAAGQAALLPILFKDRVLPIFVDESCHFSADVPPLASCTDGVVVKLMKCGGISEALRVVATCRAFGLKTMIGCMGESSIAISAGAALGCLFDYIDLDSHLNLEPDIAVGVKMQDGRLILSEEVGHGASLCY